MSKKEDVFCHECKFYLTGKTCPRNEPPGSGINWQRCTSPKKLSEYWDCVSESYYGDPAVINKNDDCDAFEKKTLSTRVIDLR
jgi:hypothetical protein